MLAQFASESTRRGPFASTFSKYDREELGKGALLEFSRVEGSTPGFPTLCGSAAKKGQCPTCGYWPLAGAKPSPTVQALSGFQHAADEERGFSRFWMFWLDVLLSSAAFGGDVPTASGECQVTVCKRCISQDGLG